MKCKAFVLSIVVMFVACCVMTGIASAKKVGIVMPTKSLERWNRDGEYLKNQFESKGYDVSIRYSDNRIEQQVKDIEGLIADDVELLIITPVDGYSIAQVLRDAEGEIPVIAYDRLIMNSKAVRYYVSFDNFKVGVLQGQFAKDALDLDNANGKKYNIEFTSGEATDSNASMFFGGAISVLQPYLDSGVLVVPSGQVDFQQVATKNWDSTALGVTKAIGKTNKSGSMYCQEQSLSASIQAI